MSQIQQILSEIGIFLNGQDCSDSEYFRHLAAVYNEAGKAVNEALVECRKLIERGDARQALLLNYRTSPSLTERARILQFPGRSRWCALCSLYKVPFPPEPDQSLIERLESTEFSDSVEQNSDLVSQWRVLGHTGTQHEKILLLRKLLKKDGSTDAWRKNLEIAERAWIREKLNEARVAQKHHDSACLDGIMRQLSSPELLHPVPPSETEPFQQEVHEYRAALFRDRRQKMIAEIENAASLEDMELLGKTLADWHALTQDPLFEPPAAADAELVKRAEEQFQRKQELLLLQMRSQELHKQVNHLIGQNAPFPQIRAAMSQLEELKQPVDPALIERYQVLEDEFALKQKRAARQKIVFGSFGVLLFCAAIGITLFYVSRWSNKKKVCSRMDACLKERKPAEILRYYESLKEKKNPAVRHPDVLARLEKAKLMEQKQQEEIRTTGEVISQLIKEFDRAAPTQTRADEIRELLTRTQKMYHSPEQEISLADLGIRLNNRQRELQEQRNQNFGEAADNLLQQIRELITQLKKPENNTGTEWKNAYRALKTQYDSLPRNQVDAALVSEKTLQLDQHLTALDGSIKRVCDYLQLREQLEKPESGDQYNSAVDRITQPQDEFDERLKTEFDGALRSMMVQKKIQLRDPDHPYVRDRAFIDTDKQALKKIREKTVKLKERIQAWDRYEIVFHTKNGTAHYFYLQSPLDDRNCYILHTKRRGGSFKQLQFEVCRPGDSKEKLTFEIKTQRNAFCLQQVPPSEKSMVLTGITSDQLKKIEERKLDKAYHYTRFQKSLERIEAAADADAVRDTIRKEFQSFCSDTRCNPLARLQILRALLDLDGSLSSVDRAFVSKAVYNLHDLPEDPTAGEYNRAFAEEDLKFLNSGDVKNIFSQRRKVEKLYKEILQEMLPHSAGVLYIRNNTVRLHWFDTSRRGKRGFIYFPDKSGVRVYLLPEDCSGKPPSPEMSNAGNGTLVFEVSPHFLKTMRNSKIKPVPASFPVNLEEQ